MVLAVKFSHLDSSSFWSTLRVVLAVSSTHVLPHCPVYVYIFSCSDFIRVLISGSWSCVDTSWHGVTESFDFCVCCSCVSPVIIFFDSLGVICYPRSIVFYARCSDLSVPLSLSLSISQLVQNRLESNRTVRETRSAFGENSLFLISFLIKLKKGNIIIIIIIHFLRVVWFGLFLWYCCTRFSYRDFVSTNTILSFFLSKF